MSTQTIYQIRLPDAGAVRDKIRVAKAVSKSDRREGLHLLNELFRAGIPPDPPLNGKFEGELVALDIAPGLSQFFEWLGTAWMPWKGKTFDAARQTGSNVFASDSMALIRIFFPLYHSATGGGSGTFRAFDFRTYVAPGKSDKDRSVLTIDYDLPENPRATIRRVLDELVQVSDGLYLGKPYVHWWWDRWQLVAYFTLAAV